MAMFDALAVWAAVDYQANLARLSEKQSRALRAVLNQTIRYQRRAVPVTRQRLAGLANIHPNSLGASLRELAAMGFIVYVAGRGKTKSRI
jgi:Mn-dependent DtxR family transcriptional regulator